MRVAWRLDEDGGGEATVFAAGKSEQLLPVVKEEKYVFEDLSELPEQLTQAIRRNGAQEGEVELPDEA